jgi:hypothetical protein
LAIVSSPNFIRQVTNSDKTIKGFRKNRPL